MSTPITDAGPDQKAVWAFVRRVGLFLLPLLALALVAELALWRTGDSWPVKFALRRQQASSTEVLYGRDFLSQQFGVYKLTALRTVRADVVAIGSSRVMQFRDMMFVPLRFYNAGGILQNAYDLLAYVDMVSGGDLPAPRLVIAGIDPWWLKEDPRPGASWLDQRDEAFSFAAHVEALQNVVERRRLLELLEGIILPSVSPFYRHEAIGSIAIRYGNGFRKDGSRQYSPSLLADYLKTPRFVDREDPPIVDRIRRHQRPFALPAAFDDDRAEIVLDALAHLHVQGIEVWVFLPPFSTESLEALDKSGVNDAWWHAYSGRFVDSLRSRGLNVVPVASPLDYGIDDRFMIDGFHPSEVFAAHVVLRMLALAPESSLLRRVEADRIRERVASAATPLAFELPDPTTLGSAACALRSRAE